MSNLTQLIAATGTTVAPGTVTSSQYYTSVGWQAGEYIYQTPTGTIAPRTTGGVGFNATYGPTTGLLTGATYTPATLQNVQYSPLYDYGTYGGTSTTAGAIVGSSTTITSALGTVLANSMYSFVLSNGNTCVVWANNSSLAYFAIYTNAGASVVAATAINGATAVTAARKSPVSGCQLTNGNLLITWSDSSNTYYTVYSASGTLITAATNLNVSTLVRYHQTIALANGGFVVAGSAGQGSNVRYSVFNSDFVLQVNGNTAFTGDNAVCCQLTSGNIAIAAHDTGVPQYTCGVYTLSGSTIYNNGTTSSSNATMSILALPNGDFAVVNNSNTQLKVYSWSGTFSSNLGSAVSTITGLAGNGVSSTVQINTNGTATIYITTYGTNIGFYSVTFPTTAATSLNSVSITTLNASVVTYAVGGSSITSLNGKIAFYYGAVTTSYPTLTFVSTSTLTSGTTVLYGPNYTPKENYTLLGVAATTVAAGNTGSVITNGGSVTLNTNYPTVTTPVSFNYQGANNSFAQRGTVVNKVAILKGLEL